MPSADSWYGGMPVARRPTLDRVLWAVSHSTRSDTHSTSHRGSSCDLSLSSGGARFWYSSSRERNSQPICLTPRCSGLATLAAELDFVRPHREIHDAERLTKLGNETCPSRALGARLSRGT